MAKLTLTSKKLTAWVKKNLTSPAELEFVAGNNGAILWCVGNDECLDTPTGTIWRTCPDDEVFAAAMKQYGIEV